MGTTTLRIILLFLVPDGASLDWIGGLHQMKSAPPVAWLMGVPTADRPGLSPLSYAASRG